MLIERYDLEVFTQPCSPGDERFSAIAHLRWISARFCRI